MLRSGIMPEAKSGAAVVMNDGTRGRLSNPRGCYCGEHGEQCWDINFVDDDGKFTMGGVQAHGGTFQLDPPCDHDYQPVSEEALELWERKYWFPIEACSKCRYRRQVKHE
jgi:hypothetical protein